MAYLSLVTRSGLVPVAWGAIDRKNRSVCFEQTPVDVMFILSYYEKDTLQPIGYPFLLQSDGELSYIQKPMTSNTIKEENIFSVVQGRKLADKTGKIPMNLQYRELKTDTATITDMHLLRKFPGKPNLQRINAGFAGSLLLASNHQNGEFDTLHVFREPLKPNIQQVTIENKKTYRYYRIETPDKSPVNIAHLEFLGEESNRYQWAKPTPLPIFYEEDAVKEAESLCKIIGQPADDCINAFDDNLETFVNANSIKTDFQNSVKIKALRIAPRNANNQIVVGDNYSLSYFDGKEWREIFRTRATMNYIKVNNAPAQGLYLLRNLDNGKEEIPFLYISDGQVWLD